MTIKSQVFGPTTWVKGDRGLLRSHTTDLPKLINMRVHRNGYLGPRPRWVDDSFTVLGSDFGGTVKFVGTLFDTGTTPGSMQVTPGVLVVQTGKMVFYSYATQASYATEAGVSTSPTSITVDTNVDDLDGGLIALGGNIIFAGVPGSNIVPYLSNTLATTAALTTFHAGLNSITFVDGTLHQGRMFYWGGYQETQSVFDYLGSASLESTTVTIHKNRLWYSDLYDYTAFTDNTQYIDFDFDIQGCMSIGASLFIWGFNGDWYILQGRSDPAAGTLNYLGKFRIPPIDVRPVLMNNKAYFPSIDHKTIVTFDEGGNIDEDSLLYLGLTDEGISVLNGTSGVKMHADSVLNTMLVLGGNVNDTHRHWQDGVWTEEDWTELPSGEIANAAQISSLTIWNYEILVTTDGTDYEIYRRQTNLDHLGQTSPSDTEAETDMVGTVKLPLIVDPRETLRVQRVIVDIEGERRTGESNPTMSCAVERQDGTSLTYTLGPESTELDFTENGGRSRRRLVFTPSDMDVFTPRAEIQLTNIRRCAIEQVTVDYEEGVREV